MTESRAWAPAAAGAMTSATATPAALRAIDLERMVNLLIQKDSRVWRVFASAASAVHLPHPPELRE
ncbi:hypothetical protein GCM10010387_53440 [Streptomyces inusitatus]|uniref:Uncharacterized protein n=1 Tax=Streptomyces inusitatus TaxID=68221 RepID=A0A918QL65_9ACTN|nr:hypothetical protein GCM10010387_53440 [Streptomyces inusitatus]